MADVATIEQDFYNALRPNVMDVSLAEERLASLKSLCPSSSLVALAEAWLYVKRKPNDQHAGLRLLLANVITQPVDNPLVYAKALSVATKWADVNADRTAIATIEDAMATFWSVYANHREASAWRAGTDNNIGMHYLHIGDYASAAKKFESALAYMSDDAVFVCWRAIFHTNAAIALARIGQADVARAHITWALEAETATTKPNRVIAEAEIAVFEGRWTDARSLARQAFDLAKHESNHVLKTHAQFLLCHVALGLQNYDAFWVSWEFTYHLAESDRALFILDSLCALRERALISMKGG